MLFGIGHFIFVFLALRLLFPDQPGRQLVGLVLAAFVSMQLYLSHYVTNEVLAATLAAASLYLALRSLKKENTSVPVHIWLGVALGAGLLTKVTLGLLVPIVFTALAMKLAVGRASIAIWLRTFGVTLFSCFAVCGWHYLRLWRHFGTPFVTNLGPNESASWWQDPGYRTIADYVRFGRCLVAPLFSGFHGFWDSIYSTMWGDALCAGVIDLNDRVPWNYDLIVAGYLLAILPAALILIGAVVAISRFIRKPSIELFLILAFCAAIMLGMIVLTTVVSPAQVKAFYGLSALVAICYFAALGWGVIERGGKTLQSALAIIFALWALNSFASVWIRSIASQRVYSGMHLRLRNQPQAAATEAIKAVQTDPASITARRFQALVLGDASRHSEALDQAREAAQLAPEDSNAHLQVGLALMNQGQPELALAEARRAVDLGPENSNAYKLLLNCLFQLDRNGDAIDAARDALVVSPFRAHFHQALALAAARQKDFVTAAQQSGYTLLFLPKSRSARAQLQTAFVSLGNGVGGPEHLRKIASSAPDSPVMLNELAWLLATHSEAAWRDGAEAVRLAERACALTRRNNPALLATLAAAQAEAGSFDLAKKTAESALLLATSSRDDRAASLLQSLLSSFRENLPYRASYP
jgi:Flp pilus assembly protein TadD